MSVMLIVTMIQSHPVAIPASEITVRRGIVTAIVNQLLSSSQIKNLVWL